jgi:hypothetical protein
MGWLPRGKPETVEEIVDRVVDKAGGVQPDRPGSASVMDPAVMRKIARKS